MYPTAKQTKQTFPWTSNQEIKAPISFSLSNNKQQTSIMKFHTQFEALWLYETRQENLPVHLFGREGWGESEPLRFLWESETTSEYRTLTRTCIHTKWESESLRARWCFRPVWEPYLPHLASKPWRSAAWISAWNNSGTYQENKFVVVEMRLDVAKSEYGWAGGVIFLVVSL